MWTVTVDPNGPIKSSTNIDCRSDSVDRHALSDDFQKQSKRNEDVEELLGFHSPNILLSPSVNGLPPPSSRPSIRSQSHSPSVASKRSASPSSITSRNQNYWQVEWTKALENAVDDLDDEKSRRLSTSFDGTLHSSGHFDSNVTTNGVVGLLGSPVKAVHNRPMSFHDSDSGIGLLKYHGPLSSEDAQPKLSRSNSMSRLNSSKKREVMLSPLLGPAVVNKSARELQFSLDDSESRRNVLMHKLKEAQTTLELQNERLCKIENSAQQNNTLVKDLKFKEMEYHKKISQLESSEEDKQRLQIENLRLREEMQDRISALAYQLKNLKTQHHSSETENDKRLRLLDHTTAALSLLEEENAKLQQDKEKLHAEIDLIKEAFGLTRTSFGALDEDNRNLKNESIRTREDNQALTRKVQEMAGQMIELRSLLQAMKGENERLSSTWRDSAEDKSRRTKQIEGYQDTITDLKARLSATSADRDRMFSEKLEMSNRIQKMVLDKEQMMKAKLNLEDQLNEQSSHRSYSKAPESYTDAEIRGLSKDLVSVRKVSEGLSSELASVKGFFENAVDQVAILERNKSMWQSQQDLGDQERMGLQAEVDRLNKMLTSHDEDDKREHQHQEEMIQTLNKQLKQTKLEKDSSEDKVHDTEAKLSRAEEDLREGSMLQHSEMDTWKNTCERLTSSVSRKESELQNLTDHCHQLEDMVSDFRQEIRVLKDKKDTLSDREDEAERLKQENRRLLQEKAENEQMMRLLETQNQMLAKNSEDSTSKLSELERLTVQVDDLRNENEKLGMQAQEMEQKKDKLMNEKDKLLLEQKYNSPSLEEVERKMQELHKANTQLREVNETIGHKLDVVNQENSKMKQAIGSSLSKTETEKLGEENMKLQEEYKSLKHEFDALASKHQRFVINHSHDADVAVEEKKDVNKMRKEKEAMQKQVILLQGQLSLLESSKKRAEEQNTKLTSELGEARAQLTQVTSDESPKPNSSKENDGLTKEVESLKQQLAKSNENIKVQEKIMKNQHEESLEDVQAELQHMRGKLQELLSEIQVKEQTIDNLEAELRASKQTVNSRGRELEEMQVVLKKMEEENKELRQNLEDIRSTLAENLAQEEEETILKRSQSEKSLQEELAEVLKAKQGKSQTSMPYLGKSLNQLELRLASAPLLNSELVPEQASTEGSDHLQNVISKYRSHSDKLEQPEQKTVKPLPGFLSSKIVTKSRFGAGGPVTPKAPMHRPSDTNSPSETPISPLAKHESDSPTPIMSSRIARRIPPIPAHKPPSPTTVRKSSFLWTLSSDNDSGPSAISNGSLGKPSALKASSNSPSLFSLRAKSSNTGPISSSGIRQNLSSSGLGTTGSSSEGINDTTEQKDINALIQKMSLFDEMAAF